MKTKSKFIFLSIAPIFIFVLFFSFFLTQKAQAVNSSMPVLQIPIPDIKFSDPKECVPGALDANKNKTLCIPWLGEYITGIINYAMGIVSILAVVVMMFGGIIWLTAAGNQTQITSAKGWIGASLTGLVIALSSYLILYTINPSLTTFNPLKVTIVKPEPVTTPSTATCSWQDIYPMTYDVGGDGCPGSPGDFQKATDNSQCAGNNIDNIQICCCKKQIFGGNCNPPSKSNSCSMESMAIFGDKASQASAICQGESGGKPGIGSGVDICADGKVASWGLFQINITAHSVGGYNCPSAFAGGSYTASNHSCTVIDQTLYDNCVNAVKDPNTNIQKAYEIYSSAGSKWTPWGFYTRECKSYF